MPSSASDLTGLFSGCYAGSVVEIIVANGKNQHVTRGFRNHYFAIWLGFLGVAMVMIEVY